MFGVGGGFLLIPMLHVALGVPLPAAVGAGLSQTIAIGFGAYLRHRGMGHAEGRFDVMLLGGSLLGVDAGTRLLAHLDRLGTWEIFGRSLPALRVVSTVGYGVLFCAMAVLMWNRSTATSEAKVEPGPFVRVRLPPYTALPAAGLARVSGTFIGILGFLNGVLAGLLGIGGGIVLVPLMLYGFGFEIRKAAGTGILVVLVVAILGTIQHARLGNVHLGLVVTLMIGSALAAQVGASLTRSLPAEVLRKGLAIILVLTVIALVSKLWS